MILSDSTLFGFILGLHTDKKKIINILCCLLQNIEYFHVQLLMDQSLQSIKYLFLLQQQQGIQQLYLCFQVYVILFFNKTKMFQAKYSFLMCQKVSVFLLYVSTLHPPAFTDFQATSNRLFRIHVSSSSESVYVLMWKTSSDVTHN